MIITSGARRRVVSRAGAYALRIAYIVVIARVTLVGLEASAEKSAALMRLQRALHPGVQAMDVVDGARNVALFAGLGALWLATAAPTRLRRAMLQATITGCLLSLTVETLQLFSPTRMSSVLDLGTNTFGAFLGAFAVALAVAAARAPRRVPLIPPPLVLVALPYALASIGEAFSPFGRLDRVPGAWGGPQPRWAAALAYLRDHPAIVGAWSDPLLAAPVGVLLVLLWIERGHRASSGAVAATIGAALTFAVVEAMRGISGGDLAPWSVVLRTLAVAVAATITATAFRRGSDGVARTRALASRVGPALYGGVLLLWSWRPLVPVRSWAELVAKLGREAFVPMAALAESFTLHSAIDVAVGFLLYVPVGAWLAARSPTDGQASGMRALWPGVLLAFVSEGGQLFIAARTLDITDALVQAAGVLVGWAIVRQAYALQRLRAGRGGRPDGGVSDTIGAKARTVAGAGLRPGDRDTAGVLLR